MPINRKKNLGFVHIPRNGGTYIEHIMGIHGDRSLSGFGENHNHYGDLEYLFGRNTQHLFFGDIINLIGTPAAKMTWFSIIRNPNDRFKSILCHRLKSPEALVSINVLIKTFIKIFRIWSFFYLKNVKINAFNFRGKHQINIYEPSIQHLMPQYKYVINNFSIKDNKIAIKLYPFNVINSLHEYVDELDPNILSGKIPNKGIKKPIPNKYCEILIKLFVKIFYSKDLKLHSEVKRTWNSSNRPLKVFTK